MSAILKVPYTLRKFINGEKQISVRSGSIHDILEEIKEGYPELAKEIMDKKKLRGT